MLRKISLTVGMPFKSKYPVRTGPTFEKLDGIINEIHLASGKVTIRGEDENPGLVWFAVISLEDAFAKNLHMEREDD